MISPSTTYPNISSAIVSPPASPPRSAANRLVRLLSTRSAASSGSVRSASPATPGHPPPNLVGSPNEGSQGQDQALREALTHEQALRKEAESQSAQKDTEIEELSTQLFEQANEMVAVERRARAKLENRVEILEKRDNDKAKRLGLLEMRVQRAERVRALLMREVKVDESEDGDEGETKMSLEKPRSMSE
jgi:GDP/GTP exchange factor Sec2p